MPAARRHLGRDGSNLQVRWRAGQRARRRAAFRAGGSRRALEGGFTRLQPDERRHHHRLGAGARRHLLQSLAPGRRRTQSHGVRHDAVHTDRRVPRCTLDRCDRGLQRRRLLRQGSVYHALHRIFRCLKGLVFAWRSKSDAPDRLQGVSTPKGNSFIPLDQGVKGGFTVGSCLS